MARPPTGHGPAHGLAPVGRHRAGLDDRLLTRASCWSGSPARRRVGARDVRQPGRGHRLAARHVRRGDRRRGGARLHAVGAAAAALRGLPLRPPPAVRRDRAGAVPPGAGRDHLRRPARHRLLVDDVDAGRSARSSSSARSCPYAATCVTASACPRSSRSPTRSSRCTSPAATSTASRAGGPVLHLAVPRPLRLVAGQPVLPLRRTRRTVAAPHREGRRASARDCAGSRWGSRALVEGPYGAFTALQQVTDKTLLIAGGIGITPIRALLEEVTARRSWSTG